VFSEAKAMLLCEARREEMILKKRLADVSSIEEADSAQRVPHIRLKNVYRVGPIQKLLPNRPAEALAQITVDVPPLAVAYEFDDLLGVVENRYRQSLQRNVYRLLKDYDATEDVLQDTWIKLHDYWMRYGQLPAPPEKLFPWLSVVASNLARDTIKARKKLVQLDLSDSTWLQQTRRYVSDHPESILLRKEVTQQVLKALGEISPQKRMQIILHYLEGFTLNEVASALRLSPGTVRARIYRALPELHATLLDLNVGSSDLALWARDREELTALLSSDE
jgi:RNA polymerase sigma factor (sigma-70 family)